MLLYVGLCECEIRFMWMWDSVYVNLKFGLCECEIQFMWMWNSVYVNVKLGLCECEIRFIWMWNRFMWMWNSVYVNVKFGFNISKKYIEAVDENLRVWTKLEQVARGQKRKWRGRCFIIAYFRPHICRVKKSRRIK